MNAGKVKKVNGDIKKIKEMRCNYLILDGTSIGRIKSVHGLVFFIVKPQCN